MYVDGKRFVELMGADKQGENPELDRALRDAERDIDSLTYGRIRVIGFEGLTPFQKENVELAICEQASFRLEYAAYLDNPLSSYGINGVSMSWDASKVHNVDGVRICGGAYSRLVQTGLTYRGVCL